jgi:hypothetical protein
MKLRLEWRSEAGAEKNKFVEQELKWAVRISIMFNENDRAHIQSRDPTKTM